MASKRLLKSYLKIEMVLLHVIKRIYHGLWLNLSFIQPQITGDPIHSNFAKIYINYFAIKMKFKSSESL